MESVDRQPDSEVTVRLDEGYEVVVYSFGEGGTVLFCANGGPGLPCDYLRDSHSVLAGGDVRVVAWDQLGCGKSDRPVDSSLWTVARYVEEAEQVRRSMGLGKVHFLGQSWGTWLGVEYALMYPQNLQSLILADGAADIPHLVAELNRLRSALGQDTVNMMLKREAEGTIDHPEYQAAITLLNYRHVCRLDAWPAALNRSLDDWNMGPYQTMQGPNEFTYTGNMKDWNRIPALADMTVPTLILVGRYDELTPACSKRMHAALPNSELVIFENSSHMPFFEEPEHYFQVLGRFIQQHRGN